MIMIFWYPPKEANFNGPVNAAASASIASQYSCFLAQAFKISPLSSLATAATNCKIWVCNMLILIVPEVVFAISLNTRIYWWTCHLLIRYAPIYFVPCCQFKLTLSSLCRIWFLRFHMVSNVIAITKGYSPASQGHLPPILQDPPINYKIINKITSKKWSSLQVLCTLLMHFTLFVLV